MSDEQNVTPEPQQAEGGERTGGYGERRGGYAGNRGPGGPGGPGAGGPGGARRRFPRRKVCYFQLIKAEYVDYKDVDTLRRFVTPHGKILPRRMTGTSAKFQRLLTTAIKRARHLALLAYANRDV